MAATRQDKRVAGPEAGTAAKAAPTPAGEDEQRQRSGARRLSPAQARSLNPRQGQISIGTFDLNASMEDERKGPRLAPRMPVSTPQDGASLPPVTELRRFNTTRLLPAKYSESVLTRIAENDEDLQLIFALDNATNERLLTEQNLRLGITPRELVFNIPHYRIINAAFCHPHPQGGRFSMPYRGSWYAGFELATAKSEVLFHRMLQFAEINWREPEELDYDQYLADFCGSFHDLRPEAIAGQQEAQSLSAETASPSTVSGGESSRQSGMDGGPEAAADPTAFSACLDPRSYIASQQLTLELLEAGSLGVIYPSTRKPGGNCIACFRPSLVCNVRKRDLYRLTWYPNRSARFLRCARTPSTGPA